MRNGKIRFGIQINLKNDIMKEITFKAENEFELFFIVEDYMNGFVQRNGKIE